jgi:dolichyl-phosphate beta-glucosyltransferase
VKPPALSVVIPAFNEAERLPQTLERVSRYLEKEGWPYEVVVVDDGSTDATTARAEERGGAWLKMLRHPVNRGKGYAVRRGMLAAQGERRLMTDADLSTPIEELPRLLARMDAGDDVVIASRALPLSRVEVHQPFYRESLGRFFNLLVRLLVVRGLSDTQCGFKLFTAAAAKECFSAALLDGFCFDVETLFIARRRGLKVSEVPVIWRNDRASRVGLYRGALAFLDLLRIRGHGLRGRYDPPGL